jgi:hypothetical protein
MNRLPRHLACCCLVLMLPLTTRAADTLHLLGFVERLCANETYCFELRVEPAFIVLAGEQIRVRFNGETSIYDPENYELSLQQQNIIPGSHLRMLISAEQNIGPDDYRASHIWIGD